ncbi:hypothetical protein FB451DRAFT_1180545 [Mycena latifolia]|nr:hypothetical protein FB451DRAFT_1180545 [Mycena latifolia]
MALEGWRLKHVCVCRLECEFNAAENGKVGCDVCVNKEEKGSPGLSQYIVAQSQYVSAPKRGSRRRVRCVRIYQPEWVDSAIGSKGLGMCEGLNHVAVMIAAERKQLRRKGNARPSESGGAEVRGPVEEERGIAAAKCNAAHRSSRRGKLVQGEGRASERRIDFPAHGLEERGRGAVAAPGSNTKIDSGSFGARPLEQASQRSMLCRLPSRHWNPARRGPGVGKRKEKVDGINHTHASAGPTK